MCPDFYKRTARWGFDGCCTGCFRRENPNDPRSKITHPRTKEMAVRKAIDEIFDGFLHDQKWVQTGCDCTTMRRIDHRLEVGTTTIAVETDEFAHRSYDPVDEIVRYNDIFCQNSAKYIWIRFSPDGGKSRITDKVRCLIKIITKAIECASAETNKGPMDFIYMFYPETSKHLAFESVILTEESFNKWKEEPYLIFPVNPFAVLPDDSLLGDSDASSPGDATGASSAF